MKVIDLLNKIANGEEFPKKVKYEGDIYEYDGIDFQNYEDYQKVSLIGDCIFYRKRELNEEVEIIEDTLKEDKKIEKLKLINDYVSIDFTKDKISYCAGFEDVVDKINEIIDKVNGDSDENN